MLNSLPEIISFLFSDAVDRLDIPPSLRGLAKEKYEEVGNWLGKTGGPGWQIYPQGSFRLGTVVQPEGPDQEYDIDLVCLWGMAPGDLAPADLKVKVGDMLRGYLNSKAADGAADVPPGCMSSRRCWTLRYPGDGFHMDVLPAAPGTGPTGIKLTDEVIRKWQYSNPIGYAQWFRGRSEEMRRLMIKAAREANVAEVPEWEVRTTLQRLVQVLKWHCAGYFGGHSDARPPSILITTLAAQAYQGEEDLFAATTEVVHRMGCLVEHRDGRWRVANPAEEKENFADKWNEYPERQLAFSSWLADVTELVDEVGQMRGQGLDRIVDRLEEGFGASGLIRKAARHLGEESLETREAGGLTMNSAGLLTKTGPNPGYSHTFYGSGH
jgi:hypothetical protein